MTLAVMPLEEKTEAVLNEEDIIEQFYRGSGKGGQRRNKVSTAVRLVHKETGLVVTKESGRKQSDNRRDVRERLAEKLEELGAAERREDSNKARALQWKPEKVITHNEQRSAVTGEGVKWTWKDFYSGKFEKVKQCPVSR